jgi:DNA-binding CsgD family transcriptional regulator
MPTAVEARGTYDLERMLRVLDCVYAAACVETSWDRAVEEVCRLGGFGGCALSSVDPLEPPPMLRASHGLSHRAATGATIGPMPRNPLLTVDVLRSAPGTVWQDRQIMPPALLATTSFWTDWMQPRGFVSWAGIIVGRDGSQVVCLEVYDRPGGASTGLRRVDLLARLAPHLSRAWRLGKTARASLQHGATRFSVAPSEPHPAASPAVDVAGAPGVIRLRAEFGLTKAEARLALYLADGASLPSMAQAFDVKLTTIRSQLQQVFAKTGTSRQAELVALLLSQGYVDQQRIPVEPAQESPGQRSSYGIPALQRTT